MQTCYDILSFERRIISRNVRQNNIREYKYEDCKFYTCYGCPFYDICYKDLSADEEGN
jgi:hypothetical protein